uniref:Bm13158, isoform b n=1 Tax=Brugia malayi TaxID=6279 RepID=A0A1I9G498_BRUMA|nr:Bm13158, isoform b [Brugia malayi]
MPGKIMEQSVGIAVSLVIYRQLPVMVPFIRNEKKKTDLKGKKIRPN